MEIKEQTLRDWAEWGSKPYTQRNLERGLVQYFGLESYEKKFNKLYKKEERYATKEDAAGCADVERETTKLLNKMIAHISKTYNIDLTSMIASAYKRKEMEEKKSRMMEGVSNITDELRKSWAMLDNDGDFAGLNLRIAKHFGLQHYENYFEFIVKEREREGRIPPKDIRRYTEERDEMRNEILEWCGIYISEEVNKGYDLMDE